MCELKLQSDLLEEIPLITQSNKIICSLISIYYIIFKMTFFFNFFFRDMYLKIKRSLGVGIKYHYSIMSTIYISGHVHDIGRPFRIYRPENTQKNSSNNWRQTTAMWPILYVQTYYKSLESDYRPFCDFTVPFHSIYTVSWFSRRLIAHRDLKLIRKKVPLCHAIFIGFEKLFNQSKLDAEYQAVYFVFFYIK